MVSSVCGGQQVGRGGAARPWSSLIPVSLQGLPEGFPSRDLLEDSFPKPRPPASSQSLVSRAGLRLSAGSRCEVPFSDGPALQASSSSLAALGTRLSGDPKRKPFSEFPRDVQKDY